MSIDLAAPSYPVIQLGADPTGQRDSTAAIQEAVNAGGEVTIPPGTYVWSDTISVGADITVNARGATLEWNGGSDVAGFVNSVPINLSWFGGTIDGNDIASSQSLFAFGASSGVNPASTYLLSCVAEDIDFVNVTNGAWTANAISATGGDYNTNVSWRNLRCTKSTSGTDGDMFELVAEYADVLVSGNPSGINEANVFTSAFLKNARVDSTVIGGGYNVMLQPYVSNGPGPWFDTVDIQGNGFILLNNGDLAALTTASGDISITARDCGDVQVGNTQYDKWHNTRLRGTVRFAAAGGTFATGMFDLIDAELAFDCSAMPSTLSQLGIVYIAQPSSGILRMRDLVVHNLVDGAVSNVIGIVSGAYVGATQIDGGDMTQNVGVPLVDPSQVGLLGNDGTVAIRDIAGFNPYGVTTPAVPAASTAVTNTTGVDCTVYVAGGTDMAVSIDGTATGVGSGSFFVPAGGTIDLGAYTAAPTWSWVGR